LKVFREFHGAQHEPGAGSTQLACSAQKSLDMRAGQAPINVPFSRRAIIAG
jgi:hypothetical protein